MKAVLLDGHTINPGDLSWGPVADLCDEFVVFEKTDDEDILERIEGCEVLMTSKCHITREIMEKNPGLKYIGETATGYNNIDIAAAADLGIAVTHIPAYSTDAVAQHTIALILELANHVGLHDQSVRKGNWCKSEYFCYWEKPVTLLMGKSLGIIGYGSIGKRVGEIAAALGMKVSAYSRDPEAVMDSDFISLHCPLTPDNSRMINDEFIGQLKDGAFIINPARGGLVDEDALARALKSGKLGGAALDVLTSEPPATDNPLLGLENCIITPHIAWIPIEMRQRVIDVLAENLSAWKEGRTLNRVETK